MASFVCFRQRLANMALCPWIHDNRWLFDHDVFLPSTRQGPWLYITYGTVHGRSNLRRFIRGCGCNGLFYGQDSSTSWTCHRRLAWDLFYLQRLHMYNLQPHSSVCSVGICGIWFVGLQQLILVLRCFHFRCHASRGSWCFVGHCQCDGKHGPDPRCLSLPIRGRTKGKHSPLLQCSLQLTSLLVSQGIRRCQRYVRIWNRYIRSLSLPAAEIPSKQQRRPSRRGRRMKPCPLGLISIRVVKTLLRM